MFLGKPESRLRAALGQPAEALAGNLHYKFGDPSQGHGEVHFDCYAFDETRCGMIIVYWFD